MMPARGTIADLDAGLRTSRSPGRGPSWGWLAAAAVMVAFIWGNSLVPGTGSSGLSLAVAHAVQAVLDACGLPFAWVTNFLVRKAAHFTEYAVLGFLIMRGARPGTPARRGAIAAVAAALVLVPAVDETIQLFVPGRSGMVADVLLDMCGGATGSAIAHAWMRLRRR